MEKITDFVKRRLQETKQTWPAVADASKVPVSTIRKIYQGAIANPGVNHIEALAKHFGYYDEQDAAAKAEA